jgi:crossover junction endodeoxyribonuclease RuvC
MLIIGLDPGLGTTGWGIVAKQGNRLSHIANGQVKTDPKAALAERLVTLDRELTDVIARYQPDTSAVEEVFVNMNPQSTLKLGQARGVCLLALARAGLPVAEYSTRLVKKACCCRGSSWPGRMQPMRWRWRFATRISKIACANPKPVHAELVEALHFSSRRARVGQQVGQPFDKLRMSGVGGPD